MLCSCPCSRALPRWGRRGGCARATRCGIGVKLSKPWSLEGPNPTEVSEEQEEDVLPCDNPVSAGVRSLLEGLGVPLSLRSISVGHRGLFHWSA